MTSPHPRPELDATAIIARDLIRFDTTNYGEGKSNGEDGGRRVRRRQARPNWVCSRSCSSARPAARQRRRPGRGPRQRASPPSSCTATPTSCPPTPTNWSVDPFDGVIKDGMLWGRGAVDMKNMDAMILTALQDILGSGRQPARDLVIAFFADEEAGGVFGSHYLVDNHPELFAGATEAISEVGGYSITLDGQRAYLLQTGEKALVWIKLVARGTRRPRLPLHPRQRGHPPRRSGRQDRAPGLADPPHRDHQRPRRRARAHPRRRPADRRARTSSCSPPARPPASSRRRCAPPPTRRCSAPATSTTSSPTRAEALIDIRTLPGEEDAGARRGARARRRRHRDRRS